MRTVADFPASHLVGRDRLKTQSETQAAPVRAAHPRHPHEIFKRRQLRAGLGASGAGAASRRRRVKLAGEEVRLGSL